MAGEMSMFDIKEGGDAYEWSQQIKFAALRLMHLTKKRIKLNGMKPFDMYAGPYASLNYGRLWSGEHQKTFFYDGIVKLQGTLREIADAINAHVDNNQMSY
jgi:hypothetical protein